MASCSPNLSQDRLPFPQGLWSVFGPRPNAFGRRVDDLNDIKHWSTIEIDILAEIVSVGGAGNFFHADIKSFEKARIKLPRLQALTSANSAVVFIYDRVRHGSFESDNNDLRGTGLLLDANRVGEWRLFALLHDMYDGATVLCNVPSCSFVAAQFHLFAL